MKRMDKWIHKAQDAPSDVYEETFWGVKVGHIWHYDTYTPTTYIFVPFSVPCDLLVHLVAAIKMNNYYILKQISVV